MYAKIPTTTKQIAAYASIVGEAKVEELRKLARPFAGARVLHLTSTAFGSDVPEELSALVPLMNDLSVAAEWQVVRGGREFARVNKAMGNGLGGIKVAWGEPMIGVWRRYNAMNARSFEGEYDFVIVHDPQPAGLRQLLAVERGQAPLGKWIWHCHLDLSAARPEVWETLRPYLDCCYDAAIFEAQKYVRKDVGVPITAVIQPAIDPLSTKNMEIDEPTERQVVQRYGLDITRPTICQMARFVKRADPRGVVEAYRAAKREVPNLQLVILWTMPGATEEVWRHYQRVAALVANDDGIHLLSNLNEVGNLEQNVFQRTARVIVHRSLRKGFATQIAEASWKGRPVVVNRHGALPAQVVDGVTGCFADRVADMAARIVTLVKDDALADRMGAAGREHVREHFLVTRALRDYLQLFAALSTGRSAEAAA